VPFFSAAQEILQYSRIRWHFVRADKPKRSKGKKDVLAAPVGQSQAAVWARQFVSLITVAPKSEAEELSGIAVVVGLSCTGLKPA